MISMLSKASLFFTIQILCFSLNAMEKVQENKKAPINSLDYTQWITKVLALREQLIQRRFGEAYSNIEKLKPANILSKSINRKLTQNDIRSLSKEELLALKEGMAEFNVIINRMRELLGSEAANAQGIVDGNIGNTSIAAVCDTLQVCSTVLFLFLTLNHFEPIFKKLKFSFDLRILAACGIIPEELILLPVQVSAPLIVLLGYSATIHTMLSPIFNKLYRLLRSEFDDAYHYQALMHVIESLSKQIIDVTSWTEQALQALEKPSIQNNAYLKSLAQLLKAGTLG